MSSLEWGLAIAIGAPLGLFWLTFVSNLFFMLRLDQHGRDSAEKPHPHVSILVPARNEAHVIAQSVTHLLAQNYPHYELILLDDNSEDQTAAIATEAAAGDPRFRLLKGKPLAADWLGKNWACHQLAQAATGDIIIFTDADVAWQPEALAALVAWFEREQAGLIAVWPTQQTATWGERLVVPLIDFVVLAYLPLWGAHYLPFVSMAAGNGQCMAFRREAYDTIGGHEAVKQAIVEDVALGRLTKQHKQRLRLVFANDLIHCRMYQSWPDVLAGFGKNIVAGFGNSVIATLFVTLFHLLVFVVPVFWLFIALVLGTAWQLPLLLAGAGIVLRGFAAGLSGQRIADAWLMPVSALLMTRIALRGIAWRLSGKTMWKGRTL